MKEPSKDACIWTEDVNNWESIINAYVVQLCQKGLRLVVQHFNFSKVSDQHSSCDLCRQPYLTFQLLRGHYVYIKMLLSLSASRPPHTERNIGPVDPWLAARMKWNDPPPRSAMLLVTTKQPKCLWQVCVHPKHLEYSCHDFKLVDFAFTG